MVSGFLTSPRDHERILSAEASEIFTESKSVASKSATVNYSLSAVSYTHLDVYKRQVFSLRAREKLTIQRMPS